MKTYVLYHANCLDGFAAAFAAWLKFGSEAEYIPCNYGQPPPPNILPNSRVYVLGFSYPRETIEFLGSLFCKQLIVLDHHASAQKDLQNLPGCHFDMRKSAAVMAWEYFFPEKKAPFFFEYLQDRDLWLFELAYSREISAALHSYPFDFEVWSGLLHKPTDLQLEGKACLRLTVQQVGSMVQCQRMAKFWLESKRITWVARPVPSIADMPLSAIGPATNATAFFSEVGEKLLQLNPEAMFSAYYFDREDGRTQWGLRSRPGFDCSAIAQAFGGGGHKQASGFQL